MKGFIKYIGLSFNNSLLYRNAIWQNKMFLAGFFESMGIVILQSGWFKSYNRFINIKQKI